ncbi:MAG TPA: nucleoside kinase [Acholeplasmataceae bacterium]|nr:nucleoside kinase [Acholeplasmataceae bacterium]
MIKLLVNKKEYSYEVPPTLEEVAKDAGNKTALAASVDQRLRELTYVITKDANVNFLDSHTNDGMRIYEATLRYVITYAVANLYPEAKVKFSKSISRSILAEVDNLPKGLNEKVLKEINDEVRRIVDSDYRIERRRISIGEAIRIYTKNNMHDKVDVLKYRSEEYVNLYETNGYMNYMFGYMLPRTGLLQKFNLFLYNPGFLIQYPRSEFNGEIPKFIDEPSFGRALKDAGKWGKTIGGNTIARINKYAEDKDEVIDFVNMCETKHNQQLNELGKTISENIEDIRLIAIAGPSSSGKTTFSNRLRVELRSRGINPVMISIDDYYLGRDKAPKNADGTADLEHVEALDIELFNHDIAALIRGEEVTLPIFDFKTNSRLKGKTIKVDKSSPIIIEGIHALNNILTESVPNYQKYKIYIAPQTQLHIDNHNPISITDLRLIRRLVRDSKYRNTSAEQTFDMWSSVRRGEFKWIYPYQNEANFVYNSELTYEFGVLKQYAIEHLRAIPTESKHFITANRLLKFLKYFVEIDEKLVPVNSILREFIGGSSFHD